MTHNVYYDPAHFGLTLLGTAGDPDLSWGFDEFTVWADADGTLRWAYDSGCSCPEPFGDLTLADMEKGTAQQAHAALDDWANSPGKRADAADLHLAIANWKSGQP